MYDACISEHLSSILKPGEIVHTANHIIDRLYEVDEKFNAIAVCGSSGLLLAGHVAVCMRKNIILVRKINEERHSKLEVEGPMDDTYIILDDLICTGKTVRHIVDSIHDFLCPYSECIGAYMYHDDQFYSRKDLTGWYGVV